LDSTSLKIDSKTGIKIKAYKRVVYVNKPSDVIEISVAIGIV